MLSVGEENNFMSALYDLYNYFNKYPGINLIEVMQRLARDNLIIIKDDRIFPRRWTEIGRASCRERV
jgi:hypothetical protein